MAIYVSDLFSTPVHFSDRNLAHRDQELRCKVYFIQTASSKTHLVVRD